MVLSLSAPNKDSVLEQIGVISGQLFAPFRVPFWEAKVAETQGIQRVFAFFCTRKGDRFRALFGTISGPFLVHFGRFLGNPPDSKVLERSLAPRPSPNIFYKSFYRNPYKDS